MESRAWPGRGGGGGRVRPGRPLGSRRLLYDGPTLGVATGVKRKAWDAPPTAPLEGWQSG